MKIAYRLERWETTVIFQVTAMNEAFRRTTSTPHFSAANGVVVKSCGSASIVCLSKGVIYLRGKERAADLHVSALMLPSVDKADARVEEIHLALADWAKNWEGFKDTPKASEKDGIFRL